MRSFLAIFTLLAVFNIFAETKIVYKSISECVNDLYSNTHHTNSSAKEHCLNSSAVNIHYSSVTECVNDLYSNTHHTKSSAKEQCLNL